LPLQLHHCNSREKLTADPWFGFTTRAIVEYDLIVSLPSLSFEAASSRPLLFHRGARPGRDDS
jgi:hypothetical protein